MTTHGWCVIAIVALVPGPIVAGCALKPSWTPVLAGAAPPRNSIVAEVDVPPAAPPPVVPPRVAVAPTAPAPAPDPPIVLPRVRDYEAIPELRDIYFDSGKAFIRPSDARILDANAAWLRANPNQLVLIEGHSDGRGQFRARNEFNMALAEERAQAAMNYLVAHGVQPSRITVLSYGEERPLCSEQTERCWSLNRRSRFLVKPR